jgi:hypothetical protein
MVAGEEVPFSRDSFIRRNFAVHEPKKLIFGKVL